MTQPANQLLPTIMSTMLRGGGSNDTNEDAVVPLSPLGEEGLGIWSWLSSLGRGGQDDSGMVQANVGQKLVQRNISRVFIVPQN
jgi:hypothetical protein